MTMRLSSLLLLIFFCSCGSTETPLDAETRQTIDSISAERIRDARKEIDSICKGERLTLMPRLVDSIRQVRLREIEEQLKTVPR